MNRTVFELIGGAQMIERLVDAFYRRVQAHPNLSQLFPQDITPIRNKQLKFLTQFFGGPQLYTLEHGHPMMRARHLPHPITPERAREWLSCMAAAMDEVGLEGPVRTYMWERIVLTARHMINSEDPVPQRG